MAGGDGSGRGVPGWWLWGIITHEPLLKPAPGCYLIQSATFSTSEGCAAEMAASCQPRAAQPPPAALARATAAHLCVKGGAQHLLAVGTLHQQHVRLACVGPAGREAGRHGGFRRILPCQLSTQHPTPFKWYALLDPGRTGFGLRPAAAAFSQSKPQARLFKSPTKGAPYAQPVSQLASQPVHPPVGDGIAPPREGAQRAVQGRRVDARLLHARPQHDARADGV